LALEFARGTLPELLRNSRALQAHLMSEAGMSILMLFATGSVLAFGILLSLFYGRRLWDRLSLRGFTPFQCLLILLTVLPANLIAVQAAIAFSHFLPPSMQQSPDIEFGSMSWPVVLLAICIFPGIGEELLFRGIMGRGLTARYGATVGVLLTSLLFGVAHLAPAHAFATFLLGIVLHLVFVSTRSLAAAMLLHALNNAAAMTLYYLQDSIRLPGYTHHDVSLFVPLPVLAACVLALGAIGIAFYATRTRWLAADGSEWSPGYFSLERPPEEVSSSAISHSAPIEVVALLIALYGTFILSLAWSATY
jgi:membrane protease YdiL (CAAX protease family)